MTDSIEEHPVEDEVENSDEFDPDNLDLKELESEVSLDEVRSLTGRIPPFLARLQWWGFGALVVFVIIVILRMIFGPPWIDRFRYPRLPVAIDEVDGLIGVIVPLVNDQENTAPAYTFFLIDSQGGIRPKRILGAVTPGPLDLAMGNDYYFYIFGDGSWVAGRKYVPNKDDEKIDVDLNQFNIRLRDGIDLIRSKDGREYLNVFTEDSIFTLSNQEKLWSLYNRYNAKDWGEENLSILDLARSHVLAGSGAAFLLLDFPEYINGYKKYDDSTVVKTLKQRPQFPGEFLYKPAWIVPADSIGDGHNYFILKNDHLFNFPYKYSDNQVFLKSTTSTQLTPFEHPFFAGKDIRGMTVISPRQSTILGDMKVDLSKRPDIVILYEANFDFRLAGLKLNREKPLWDIYLGRGINQ